MSPSTLTPLWPIILNELYGQLAELRDLLGRTTDRLEIRAGLVNQYLSVSKLLDQALILPAHFLPDFQVHTWAFVQDQPTLDVPGGCFSAVSHQISGLLGEQVTTIPRRKCHCPYINMPTISDIKELQPFFTCLSRDGLFSLDEPDMGESPETLVLGALTELLDREFLQSDIS